MLRAHSVIECEAGMLRKWEIRPGVVLEIRGTEDGDTTPERTA